MRKEIKLNCAGGIINTNVKVTGIIAAGYRLELYEAKSNNVIYSYSGTNEYDDDDYRSLPNSALKNIGRVLWLDTIISSLKDEIEEKDEYSISLQIFQDDKLLDEAIYTSKLENQVQSSIIIVKLV